MASGGVVTPLLKIDDHVFFAAPDRALVTLCTKCQSPIRLHLGSITDAATARQAVKLIAEQPGMCPPLENGSFAAWAHPELSFYGYWQVDKVLALIDLLGQEGILEPAPAGRLENHLDG
jgi:hypothetical protein